MMAKLQAMYGPQLRKSLKTVLTAKFANEYAFLGGSKVAAVIAEDVLGVVDAHLLPHSAVAKGQVPWLAVGLDASAGYGKTIEDAPLVPVVLTLVADEDIRAREKGEDLREIKKRVVERILKETYTQGGVLSATDVALLLSICHNTAAAYIREIEKEKNILLPTRGSVHDLGPKTTHKAQIVRMVKLKKMPPPEVARATSHSLPDVDRYLNDFERVEKLVGRLPKDDIPFVTKMSPSLVDEYVALLNEIEVARKGGEG
jgi:hypothetical protein